MSEDEPKDEAGVAAQLDAAAPEDVPALAARLAGAPRRALPPWAALGLTCLGAPEPRQRRDAIVALAGLGDAHAIRFLAAALADPQADVRRIARAGMLSYLVTEYAAAWLDALALLASVAASGKHEATLALASVRGLLDTDEARAQVDHASAHAREPVRRAVAELFAPRGP